MVNFGALPPLNALGMYGTSLSCIQTASGTIKLASAPHPPGAPLQVTPDRSDDHVRRRSSDQ